MIVGEAFPLIGFAIIHRTNLWAVFLDDLSHVLGMVEGMTDGFTIDDIMIDRVGVFNR